MSSSDVVDRIRGGPHWRVVYRPTHYTAERVSTLSELSGLVDRHAVALRGWNFPHVSSDAVERGPTWIGSWSTFMGHLEYWRFFQSAQFLYLSAVREVAEEDWDRKLRAGFASRVFPEVDVERIPGFFSIENFVYTVSEFYEFAARLASADLFDDQVQITVELHGIEGFALTTGPDRAWRSLYQATSDVLSRPVEVAPAELVADTGQIAMGTIAWFFERFGWLEMNVASIQALQDDFLQRG